MMIGDALAQKPRECTARKLLFRRSKRKWSVGRQRCRKLRGEIFSRFAARREHQDRAEISAKRIGDQSRPPAADVRGRTLGQGEQIDLFQRNRTLAVLHEQRVASQAAQPRDKILGIGDAPAQEQELGAARRQRDRELVSRTTARIPNHLVFIDHEQCGSFTAEQFAFLRLERRHHHPRIEPECQVACREADIPAARAPFRELVIRQRAGWHGEDRLSAECRLEQLENKCLPRASRRIDHHVAPFAQGVHSILLPEIRKDESLEGGQRCVGIANGVNGEEMRWKGEGSRG